MPRFQSWFLPESLNILSVKLSHFIWEPWMVCAHNMGTTAISYLHPFLAPLKAGFCKALRKFHIIKSSLKKNPAAALPAWWSSWAAFLLLNHKPWTSWWVMALSLAITVFRVQCSSSSCATPKHFNQLKRSSGCENKAAATAISQPKATAITWNWKNLLQEPVVQEPSERAFLHSQSYHFLPIYSCKTQPHKCSKEVKPKGQNRVASTDQFFKTV